MPGDSPEWYYMNPIQRVGPVDAAHLRSLLETGAVPSDALVWKVGMPDWQPVSVAFHPQASGSDRVAAQATWSLVLGAVSVFGLFVFVTLPAAIAGLILGIKARNSSRRGQALGGIALSSLGLLVFVWLAAGFLRAILELGWDQFLVEFLASLQQL